MNGAVSLYLIIVIFVWMVLRLKLLACKTVTMNGVVSLCLINVKYAMMIPAMIVFRIAMAIGVARLLQIIVIDVQVEILGI